MTQNNGIREAVGVFDAYEKMEEAINALQIAGFDRSHISVLGTEASVREQFGTTHIERKLLEDDPKAPHSHDIKREELFLGQGVLVGSGLLAGVVAAVLASGGMAFPGIVTTALVGGAGGTAVGIILAKILGDKYVEFFKKQLDEGGLILWVNTPTPEMEEKAQEILRSYGARDVHIHELSKTSENVQPGRISQRLKQITDQHRRIISTDRLLQEKLASVFHSLEEAPEKTESYMASFYETLREVSLYAKDMGAEEERLIDETQAVGIGKQETESERYFALAHDLDALKCAEEAE